MARNFVLDGKRDAGIEVLRKMRRTVGLARRDLLEEASLRVLANDSEFEDLE
jgi:hypothetical protein